MTTKAKGGRPILASKAVESRVISLWSLGQAALYHIKKGIQVTQARVYLTHANIHAIWRDDSDRSRRLRSHYPLEMRLPRLGEKPEIIDCRQFMAPWNVRLPAPTPPASYPPDTGDPVKDFHPPHVEPLTILDEVASYAPAESENLPSPADRH